MMMLVCTTRFERSLERYEWNNAPDGTPSSYLLLALQLDRLLAAARLACWPATLDYAALESACDAAVRGADNSPLKLRVLLAPSGSISVSAFPIEPLRYDPTAASCFTPGLDAPPQFAPILSLCIDTQATSGTVSMKTTYRKPYDDARTRVGIPPLGAPRDATSNHPHDVILFNTSRAIMETSIYNVAFYRCGKWLTPPLSVGCIAGVFRRWLLDNGRIHEAQGDHLMSVDSIQNNEWVLVFNGVAGCRLGRVMRTPSDEKHTVALV